MTRFATSTIRAMGTRVTCAGPVRHEAFEIATRAVRAIFEREERRFSRFRSESELSRVNARAGSWVSVSAPFAELVRVALDAWHRTDGRFDPTLLGAVVAAGYDRDFDELIAGARAQLRPAAPGGRAADVRLDGTELYLPEGVALDLGGIAKGWTVDLAVRAALRLGLPWVLVNAGGDLRIEGAAPGGGVDVAVEDPEIDGDVGWVALGVGALATSSVTRRSWGPALHHLIDPATGAPSAGPVLQATVWASTCAEAEVSSKDAILEGEPYLDRAPALLVLRDGRIVTNLQTTRAAA